MKKLHTLAVVLVIFGGILLFLSIALAAMSMYNSLFGVGSMGIIGGADAGTVWTVFYTRLTDKYGALTVTGLVSIAVSVVLFIVSRKSK